MSLRFMRDLYAHLRTFGCVAALVVTACSTTTGVQQLAPNTYTVSVGAVATGSISGNDVKAKREALKEAAAFCSKMGKVVNVQNLSHDSSVYGSTQDLVFHCEAESADAPPSIYHKEPAVVIENQPK
jgi:hypothetical protein